MKNTSWEKVQPGQIVSFIYKSKESKKGIRRTVLCLNPKLSYRKKNSRLTYFFVGLQLDTAITKPITATKFENLIKEFGGLSKDGSITEIGRFSNTISKQETQRLYQSLQDLIEKYKIFRTYNLRECKKRRVYLEDTYRELPKDSVDELIQEQKLLEFDFEL
jgi:hypothetical protein|tara:strand:- start:146 stop:631 length:486 start_codon:yes stop_codon:yes gene_type:complete